MVSESRDKRAKRRPGAVNARRRILLLAAFLFLWTGVIFARLVNLQIIDYGDLSHRAARQQQRTVEVAPRRGIIYDRNGHELAMTINVDSFFAVPSEIEDPAKTARALARVLGEDPRVLLARLESNRNFVWIARKQDSATSDRIRSLDLKGIYSQKESKRFYPKHELAAQVLGYVGVDDEGLGGIEREFDSQLRGKPGRMLVSVDARQRSLGRVEKQPEPGDSLVLTIDEKIQYIAERELDRSMAETQAESGIVMVQNPHTGEVLALAMRPGFDPNQFRTTNPANLRDRAVGNAYEPGSTFKLITIAAALEEKLTTPDEVIDCQNGSITIFGHKIHDHKAYSLLTVSQILQNSSDVGAIKLGLRLGEERFYHYIRAFGFGSETGIELPGETRGITRPVDRWSKVSIGAISMGQEIGASALQLAAMISTIANDGVYNPPRIVAGTFVPGNKQQTVVFHPAGPRRVISPLTAVRMKKMMENVVLYGTGKKALLDGYTSAGKTGTAQKIDPATGTYSRWKHIASFGGFAPVNNPSITVYAMLDSAKGPHEGGQIAAPLFARVAQQVLTYMGVPHDVEIQNPQRMILRAKVRPEDLEEGSPDRLDQDSLAASMEVASDEPAPALRPVGAKENGVILAPLKTKAPGTPQSVESTGVPDKTEGTAPVATHGTVILETGSRAMAPSLLGKTVRSAIESAQRAGIEIEIIGDGVARSQSPAPGERIPPGGHVVVHFTR